MKFAIVYSLHGNEKYGESVAKKFPNIFSIKGNPKAFEKNVRFIESDLNRSFCEGESYECQRAKELLKRLENFDYVLDLHSSSEKCPLFGIITKPNKEKIEFAKKLGLKKLVIMSPDFAKENSLIDFLKCGLSLEIGPHEGKENVSEVETKIKNFLKEKNYSENLEIYEVFRIIKKERKNIKIKNFESVKRRQILTEDESGIQKASQNFTAILVGEKSYDGILCLAARKSNFINEEVVK